MVKRNKKKTFLVDFGFTTRVTADANATKDQIASLAVERIRDLMTEDGIASFICQDNIGEIREDTECPYGSFNEDKTLKEVLLDLIKKKGRESDTLTKDDLPDIDWTFILDVDECVTLPLHSVTLKKDGDIELVWKERNFNYTESLDKMDLKRKLYVKDEIFYHATEHQN